MSPYLNFEMGNGDNARGRALLYIQNKKFQQTRQLQTLVDINGIALQEAFYGEIQKGRLFSPEIFEPFFVSTSSLDESFSSVALLNYAQNSSRDLIPVYTSQENRESLAEIAMEQAVARYTTIYRENIYLHIVRQMANEIFRKKQRAEAQPLYVSLLKIAEYIHLMSRARREEQQADLEYFATLLKRLQPEIPQISLARISEAVYSGNSRSWQDATSYLDIFFVTLKKHFPLTLDSEVVLTINSSCEDWLQEDFPLLCYSYFLALLEENYEKAQELQSEINFHETSQSLEGCL